MEKKSIHLPFLDIARGVAILIVFLVHCLGPSYGFYSLPWGGLFRSFDVPRSFLVLLPLTFGEAGVAIFFVVSGFCIHLSHMRSGEENFKVFFLRRFFRIYPPYLFALIVFSFIYPFRLISQFDPSYSWMQFGSHLLLIHNFYQNMFFGINPTFWSIAVEVQLYCLYPLLLVMLSKLGWKRTLIITGIVELTIRSAGALYHLIANDALPYWFASSTLAFWLSWTIGVALADRYLQGKPLELARYPIWLWLCVAVASCFVHPLSDFSFVLFAMLTAIVLSHALEGKLRWPKTRWECYFSDHLRFAGLVSYSLYLIHFPILNLIPIILDKFYPNTTFHPLVRLVLCLSTWPIILALSWLMYRKVEKPSINAGKILVRRLKFS